MASIYINLYICLIIIILFYCEFFYNFCFENNKLLTYNLKTQKLKIKNFFFWKSLDYIMLLVYFCIYIVTNKTSGYNNYNLVYTYVILLLIYFLINYVFIKNFHLIIILSIVIFIYLLCTITNLLYFLFLIELIGTIYYFFFIENMSKVTNINLVKYKNLLLLYLWNSLLTTLLYGFSCLFIVNTLGTLNFLELNNLNVNSFYLFLLFFSFCWKLGLPTFHYLKLEIYKFISKENLILFSIISISTNYAIIYFIVTQNFFWINSINFKFFNVLILTSISLIINNFKILNFQQFISYSSIISLNFIIILFII